MIQIAGTLLRSPCGKHILMLQRHNGNWDLPKGHVEDGESLSQGAIRETFEETGITPRLTGPFQSEPDDKCEIWVAPATCDDVNVKISHEHKAHKWVPVETAIKMLYPPLAKLVSKMTRAQFEDSDMADHGLVRGSLSLLSERREQNKDGTTSCGVFIPLPFDIARQFAPKAEDDSVPHLTILYAGDLSPCDYKKFVRVVCKVARNVEPFPLDLSHYHEFMNRQGQRIPHMKPGCLNSGFLGRLHGMLRRAVEAEGIKVAHNYGKGGSGPYEAQFKAHATLAYLDKDVRYKGAKPTGNWRVTELECWGHEKYRLPLGRSQYDQPTGLFRGRLLGKYPLSFPDKSLMGRIIAVRIKATEAEDERLRGLPRLRPIADAGKRVRLQGDDPVRKEIKLVRLPLNLIKVAKKQKITVRPKIRVKKKPDIKLTRGDLKIDESKTSLKGWERHPAPAGAGPSLSSPRLEGSLAYLRFLKDEEKRKRKK